MKWCKHIKLFAKGKMMPGNVPFADWIYDFRTPKNQSETLIGCVGTTGRKFKKCKICGAKKPI